MQRCITFSLQHHETVDKSLKIPAAWYKPPFCGARSADFAGCSRRGRRAVFLWVCGQLWCAKRLCKALFSAESTLGAAASASAVNGLPSSRASSHTGGWWWTQLQETPPIHCGSELARESGGSACRCGEWAAVIASKLAPTGGGGGHRSKERRRSIVGASLLAKAVGLLAGVVNGLASSRAGSLPQGGSGHRSEERRRSIVGASLLAMAVGR